MIKFLNLIYYLIGRLEERKNIISILDAYKILKERYNIPHQLILAGNLGYGYKNIKLKIRNLLEIKNSKERLIKSAKEEIKRLERFIKNLQTKQ